MNGRSGKNNVEIKSGQQVCVVFFLFFISLALHFAMTEEAKEESEISLWGRWMRKRRGCMGHSVSHVGIFLKDKSKTPPASLPCSHLKYLPSCKISALFPHRWDQSQSSGDTEIWVNNFFFKFVRIWRQFYVAGLVIEVYYAEGSFYFSCELLRNVRFLIHFILLPGKYERWLTCLYWDLML